MPRLQLSLCTLLVSFLDAHSSSFPRKWMHTPHYSQDSGWVEPGFTHSWQGTLNSTLTMHSPDKFNGCTLLIIPSTLYDAHSSLFPRKWLSIYMIYTLLPMHRLQHSLCTLLMNLLDAHSSLFHQLYMMHNPDYSQEVAEYIHDLHIPAYAKDFNYHYPLSG